MTFTAWQLIGWDGCCGKVRRVGGRAVYSDVMFQCDTPGEKVKLARLDPGPREVRQWVEADCMVEIVKLTDAGREFLRFQGLSE